MLKAIQILGSSSGFVSHHWKRHTSAGFSFVAISIKPLSSTSPSLSCLRGVATTTTSSSFLPLSSSTSRTCTRAFPSSVRSESNPGGTSSSVAVQSAGNARKINFCQWCGGATKHEIPDGEEKTRAICTVCGKIAYQNPKMVVGCLIEHDNKVLLCKRKIQPSYGLWLHGNWGISCRRRNQGNMGGSKCRSGSDISFCSTGHPSNWPGPESSECQLFSLDDIPFNSLAFSSMLVSLNLYVEDVKAGRFKFHYGTINKRPGTSPSDIHAFTLDYHMQL